MDITILHLPSFLTGLGTVFLGLFVLSHNRSSELSRSFFMLCLSVSIWQFGNVLSWASRSDYDTIFWGRVLYIGVSFIPSFYYHFSVEFNKIKKRENLVPAIYLLSIFLLLFLLRKDFIIGSYQAKWGSHLIVGPSHKYFLILWFVPVLLSIFNFNHGYRNAVSSFEKQRRKFLFVCYAISSMATIDFLPSYQVNIPFPLGFIPWIFFIASTAYAIVRYRILDINVILKRVSIITFLAISGGIFIYIASFYLQPNLVKIWGKKWVFFPVSISFLIGLSLFRLITIVRESEEKELSRQFSYRHLLKRQAERFSRVRNMKELLSYLIRDLSSWVRLDYVGVMTLEDSRQGFVLVRDINRTKSRRRIPRGTKLFSDHPLVVEILKMRKPLVASELKYFMETKATTLEEMDFITSITEEMQRLGAEITIPCFCEDKLLALVNLGRKLTASTTITRDDIELFVSLSTHVGRTIQGFRLKEEKIQLIVASQNILITAIEAKDSYTRGHTDRVAEYSYLIGKRLEKLLRHYPNGLSNLKWAAQLHDVGKIGIPDTILLKKASLSDKEWEIIREHPLNGLNIVSPMREWLGDDICAGILHHHENYDGTGYPGHQKKDGIHLFARIIRVADAYDAMILDRPYRSSLPKEEIIAELVKYKGTYFDPSIVNIMLELYNNGEI